MRRAGRDRRLWLLIGLGLLLLAPALVGAVFQRPPSPRTVRIFPGESLQEAIDLAPAGSVLCLAPGTYRETVRIGRSITIRAEDPSGDMVLLDGPADRWASVFIESVSNGAPCTVVLEGLTLQSNAEDGLLVGVAGSASVEILGCRLAPSPGVGVQLYDHATALIQDSDVTDQQGYAGVYVGGASSAVLERCHILGNPGGNIEVTGTAVATIVNCTVSGPEKGFWITDDATVSIQDCEIARNGTNGIAVRSRAEVEVLRCGISDNGDVGVVVTGVAEMTVRDCVLTGNKEGGVRVGEAARAELTGNTIRRNGGWGVEWIGRVGESQHLSGCGNNIQDADGAFANQLGSVIPESLRYLTHPCKDGS